jgi:hypothetical protein
VFHARPDFFRLFAWCLSVFFTLVSIPHFELIAAEFTDLIGTVAYAAEEQVDTPATSPDLGSTPDIPSDGQNNTPDKPDEKPQDDPNAPTEPPKPGDGTSQNSVPGFEPIVPEAMLFTGATSHRVPIDVPPGRAGVVPNLAITYNSYQGNGFLGVGWNLDMGVIQRSTKRGVNYSANNFTVVMGGSQADIVAKPAWGANYYGNKIDETLQKYYFNPAGGWEVTTKTGQKLYYGSSPNSRQESSLGVFKWALDRVEDTNGNYMTVSYTQDRGAVYLDTIRYTGNTSVDPSYEVRFIKESRSDVYHLYTSNASVLTAYRLSGIDIYGTQGKLLKRYQLQHEYSRTSSLSRLISVTQRRGRIIFARSSFLLA